MPTAEELGIKPAGTITETDTNVVPTTPERNDPGDEQNASAQKHQETQSALDLQNGTVDGVVPGRDTTQIDPETQRLLDDAERDIYENKAVVEEDDTVDDDIDDEPDASDDLTGPKSVVPDGSLTEPSHNANGHRNMFVNAKGQRTILDDETAEKFYTIPKFYSYVYDNGAGDNVHVSTLEWCTPNGGRIGSKPGDSYELDK